MKDIIFDKRQEFAFKLKKIMEEKEYTKTRLCKEADISRPTLDKLLSAKITNMTSFRKHVSKISTCLEIDPEFLVEGINAEEIVKDRYLKHIVFENADKLEDFVNKSFRIEVVNVSTYEVNQSVCHMLWYWEYTEK